MKTDTASTATHAVSSSHIQDQVHHVSSFLSVDHLLQVLATLTPYAFKVLFALIIVYVGKKLAYWISKLIKAMVNRSLQDEMLSNFVGSTSYFVLLVFVVIAGLSQIGVDTTSFVAIIGAAGLAIGLSLKNSLQNFAAGIMILIFKPFKKDNVVDVAGVNGVVTKIGIMMLELQTFDNRLILIPNSKVFSNDIVNYHANPIRRIDLALDISYNADVKTARKVVLDVFEHDPRILKNPEPSVIVGEWAASSIRLYARPWVETSDYGAVKFDLLEKLLYAFNEANIEIPFNQLDVNIRQTIQNSIANTGTSDT